MIERLQKGACQVAYLSFGVCELHEMADREGKPAVGAVPWLSTNIGSRQATLAAKKAWMQWSTAKRLENSSSCRRSRVSAGQAMDTPAMGLCC